MPRAELKVGSLIVALLVSSTPALATPSPVLPPTEPSAQAPLHNRTARELFEDGLRAYDAGHDAEAIALFKDAYAISSAPLLLFNIAQAYHRMGECREAVDYYAKLMSTSPADASNLHVAQRFEDAQLCVQQKARERAPEIRKAPVVAPPPRPEGLSSYAVAARPPSASRVRDWALLSMGLGVGLLGVGAYCALEAHAESAQLHQDLMVDGAWSASAAGAERNRQRLVISAGILGIVGTAVLTAGITFLIRSSHRSERP